MIEYSPNKLGEEPIDFTGLRGRTYVICFEKQTLEHQNKHVHRLSISVSFSFNPSALEACQTGLSPVSSLEAGTKGGFRTVRKVHTFERRLATEHVLTGK